MEKVINNNLVAGLVSIIIPVYNSEQYLHQCIESIVNQSYKNIEIVLINDGSTDNSGEICNEYTVSDNRIKVMNTQNNGPAAARNVGIENSKGEFIFFVDSDDFIENDALKLLIESYKQHKADIIVGAFNKINNSNVDYGHNVYFPSNKLLAKEDIIDYTKIYLKKPNRHSLFTYIWGKLFKSSIIKKNNIAFKDDLHTFEDFSFNFDYLKFTNSVLYLKKTIYNYRVYDTCEPAGMKVYDNMAGYSKSALSSIFEFLEINGLDINAIKKEIGHANIFYMIITIVRMCRYDRNINIQNLYKLIYKIINDSYVRDNLQFYSPSKGDSRILPILMKLKLVWPIIWVCQYKAYKRYKSGKK